MGGRNHTLGTRDRLIQRGRFGPFLMAIAISIPYQTLSRCYACIGHAYADKASGIGVDLREQQFHLARIPCEGMFYVTD